jgi:hypothetical protein
MNPKLSWKDKNGQTVNLVTELLDGHIDKATFDQKVMQQSIKNPQLFGGNPERPIVHLSRWLVN